MGLMVAIVIPSRWFWFELRVAQRGFSRHFVSANYLNYLPDWE